MAAGRHHVSRRREYYSNGYSRREEEVLHYKNGTHDAKSSRGGGNHKHKNGYRFLSNGHNSGSRQVEARFDDASSFKNGKVSKCDDAVQLPSEKKRKFSPIIWDLDDKEVRISSKNRIVPTTTTLSCPKSSVCLVSQVLNVASDEDVAKGPILDNEVKGVEFLSHKSFFDADLVGTQSPEGLYPSLPQEEQIRDDNLDKVQLEVEEFVQVQNISTSRWASDSPSDVSFSDSEGTCKREEQPSERSTPESGEFYRESFEDEARLSGSEGLVGGHSTGDEFSETESVDEDVMDFDKTPDEVTAVDGPAFVGQRNNNMIEGCRSVYEFEQLNKINEGTYGIVYRARDKKTGEIVALKKVKMNLGRKQDYLEYGFPSSSLREINILLSFNHPSIVNVKEVVMDDHDLDSVFMVMEYMEHDLKGLMESMKRPFSTSEVKCLMLQLLDGVKHLHDNWVLHRDLKTSNLLLNNQGELKICDFGMSRQYGSPLKPYTSLVVTLWYRAPELLLGAKKYSTAVDMWSLGCIMAEMLAKKPLFNGRSETDQIDKIFKTLGTPTEKIWPGLSELPGARANFVKQPYNLLRKRFPAASFIGSPVLSEAGFDLLNKLLTYDPEQRITVDAALNHDWFREVSLPKCKELMPTFPTQNQSACNRHLQELLKVRKESRLQKCSGDCQHNHLLNAPLSEEAPLWNRCEPNFVQA